MTFLPTINNKGKVSTLHDSRMPSSYPRLPPNVHISQHPCLRAKLSQLRSRHTNARETKALVHEIALIVGCQALEKGLDCEAIGTVRVFTVHAFGIGD